LRNPLEVIPEIASEGMKQLKKALISLKKSNSTKTKTSIALIFTN
jgi:hypothetical protein